MRDVIADETLQAEVVVKPPESNRVVVPLDFKVEPSWFEQSDDDEMISTEGLLARAIHKSGEKLKKKEGFMMIEMYEGTDGKRVRGSSNDYEWITEKQWRNGDIMIMDTVPYENQVEWRPEVWKKKGDDWVKMELKPQYSYGTVKQWHQSAT